MAAAYLAVQTFGGLLRAMEAEARHPGKAPKARRIVEEHVAHVLVLQPDQIGDAVYLGEAPAELDVLAQPHAVEVGDLSLPAPLDIAAGGDFGLSVECTDATLVAVLARLFAIAAGSIRLHIKFVYLRRTLLAIAVLMMFVHSLPRVWQKISMITGQTARKTAEFQKLSRKRTMNIIYCA